MVTPYEGCVNVMFFGGVVTTEILPEMFDLVTHWCVHGVKRICVDAVGVDAVWVVCVGVDGTLYAVVTNIFVNLCKASPWRPWNV